MKVKEPTMKPEEMSAEELVSYRDDVLEFFTRDNTADERLLQDIHNELLSRLEDGARAKAENSDLKKKLSDMQCCGNCINHKVYDIDSCCDVTGDNVHPAHVCEVWKSDNRTKGQRQC